MIKESCLYYEKHNDMGATIHWCQNYPHLNFDCEKCERYIEKNFVRVVRCKDCVSYGTSISGVPCEGYCKQLEYTTRKDDDFCSWGRRKNEAD